MAEEIQEAVQIIRVGYDGIEIAMKLGGASIEQIKNLQGFCLQSWTMKKLWERQICVNCW